jgi:hypothetical protein
MKSYGKSAIMYEGGWDRDIRPVSASWSVTPTRPYASAAFDGKTNRITLEDPGYAAALAPGHFVVGYGIPPLTRVVSVSGAGVQLSNNTTVNLPVGQFVVFTPQQMFLLAAKRSQAFATAMLSFFNQFGSGAGMPSEYIPCGVRWGHTFPTAYGFSNAEWGDLDLAWQQEAARNRGLS